MHVQIKDIALTTVNSHSSLIFIIFKINYIETWKIIQFTETYAVSVSLEMLKLSIIPVVKEISCDSTCVTHKIHLAGSDVNIKLDVKAFQISISWNLGIRNDYKGSDGMC